MTDLNALIATVEQIAAKKADGHWTLMKFTTGYKAVLGTPEVYNIDREAISNLPTAATAAEAIQDLIDREGDIEYFRDDNRRLRAMLAGKEVETGRTLADAGTEDMWAPED